jgi:histidyl-tRNA synthetase
MPQQFQALPGTFDVLAPESARYGALVARFARHVQAAGYGLVVSPLIEEVDLFRRVGESTDVVRKEMYDFEDKGGRHIALRPEGTAQVMRAYLQHHPQPPFKAWYAGPNFRYERQQAGRFRQHHQVGLEAIGTADPDIDVEVIALQHDFYKELGLAKVTLKLNSLGDATCRPAYRQLLLDYLTEHQAELCDEHKATIADNPLRVLDCKREACIKATEHAPFQVDHLCADCKQHLDRVTQGLDALGVGYQRAPRLVRGLDYYTRTTFEFAADALESAQNAIGGGGRYDGLAEALGGAPTPGIGFGSGIERILLACDAEGVFATDEVATAPDVFVIDTVDGTAARDLTAELRRAGIAADRAFDGRSFKAQMKQALRSNARFAVVIEDRGIELRTLQEKGDAEALDRATIVDHLRKRLDQ